MTHLRFLNPRQVARGTEGRAIFAAMLRAAFPGRTQAERAERGARVLGISTAHYIRLEEGKHRGRLDWFIAVLGLIGVEATLSIVTRIAGKPKE